MEDIDIIERFNTIIGDFESAKLASEILGVDATSLSQIKNGKRSISKSLIDKLSDMGVSIDWLLTGRGEKYLKDLPKEKVKDEEFVVSLYTTPEEMKEDFDREFEEQEQKKLNVKNKIKVSGAKASVDELYQALLEEKDKRIEMLEEKIGYLEKDVASLIEKIHCLEDLKNYNGDMD